MHDRYDCPGSRLENGNDCFHDILKQNIRIFLLHWLGLEQLLRYFTAVQV